MKWTLCAAVGVLVLLSSSWSHGEQLSQHVETEVETQDGPRVDEVDMEVDLHVDVIDTDTEPTGESILPEPLWPPPDPPGSELTDKGRNVRGIYLPVGFLVTKSVNDIVMLVAQKLKATAVVLDIKDDFGRVTFSSELPMTMGRPHGMVKHMKAIVERLQEKNVYVIGRLVCFKDDVSTLRRPGIAARDRRTGKAWRNPTGNAWLDPYSEEAADLLIGVAKAAVELGFDEIQLDYVRFPVDPKSRYAVFPSRKEGVKRYEAIASLLYKMDQAVSRPLSADVFGLTAFNESSAQLLGQVVEQMASYLDAISPMLYLANWPEKYWQDPSYKTSYNLTYTAVKRLHARLGDEIAIRPLLQGFRFRNAIFGARYLEDQISAAQAAGAQGYLFWNQAGYYAPVSKVWRKLDAAATSSSSSTSPKQQP
jgi:hypothetical protein